MLVLIRHAATIPTAKKTYIGTTDLPLSPKGEAQARELGSVFAAGAFRAIYASPLQRTLQTASQLAQAQNRPVTILKDLREIHLGQWENRPMAEIREQVPDQYAARGNNLADFRPPEGESFSDLAQRAWPMLEQMAHGPLPCAVVTHAGIIRVLLCRVLGLPLNDIFQFRPGHLCCWGLKPISLEAHSPSNSPDEQGSGSSAPIDFCGGPELRFRVAFQNLPPAQTAAQLCTTA